MEQSFCSPEVFLERYSKLMGQEALKLIPISALAACWRESAFETMLALLDSKELTVLRSASNITGKIMAVLTNTDEMKPFTIGKVETLYSTENVPFFLVPASRPVQIGVPSESIKSFINQNRSVPTIYVSLPDTEGAFYSDVEFPLFWNYFIEQACLDPSKRVQVIGIGPAALLDNIKLVFRESM